MRSDFRVGLARIQLQQQVEAQECAVGEQEILLKLQEGVEGLVILLELLLLKEWSDLLGDGLEGVFELVQDTQELWRVLLNHLESLRLALDLLEYGLKLFDLVLSLLILDLFTTVISKEPITELSLFLSLDRLIRGGLLPRGLNLR